MPAKSMCAIPGNEKPPIPFAMSSRLIVWAESVAAARQSQAAIAFARVMRYRPDFGSIAHHGRGVGGCRATRAVDASISFVVLLPCAMRRKGFWETMGRKRKTGENANKIGVLVGGVLWKFVVGWCGGGKVKGFTTEAQRAQRESR